MIAPGGASASARLGGSAAGYLAGAAVAHPERWALDFAAVAALVMLLATLWTGLAGVWAGRRWARRDARRPPDGRRTANRGGGRPRVIPAGRPRQVQIAPGARITYITVKAPELP